MLHLFRRGGRSGRGARVRSAAAAVRLTLERLEDRVVPVVPLPPTNLTAAGISSSAISLSWDASTDPTVTGYNVYEKVWVPGVHGGKGSGGGGHYAYNGVASNLTDSSDTVSGLATGSTHTYLVTAVNSDGQSLYSLPGTAETWVAPKFSNASYIFMLSNGALWSGTVNATAGLTTQVKMLVSGNPLTYSIDSGPSTASIDPATGVLSYTPDPSEVGTQSITLDASNSLGSVTQTIQFNVSAQDPTLLTPTLSLNSTSSDYTGKAQGVSVTAFGTDGVTPVKGSFAFSYNGMLGITDAGTYQVLATFTSSDPAYGNATLLTTYTINPVTPTFNYLSAPTIAANTATTTVSGYIWAGTNVPAGEYVIVTLNGVAEAAPVGTSGQFSATFATGDLPEGQYAITFDYAGDANFNATDEGSSTLTVIPTAPPQVTTNPTDRTVSVGDGVSFTAAATGTPTPTVQWQVSTDGGQTFTNVTGNASATTTTLTFTTTTLGMNGYKYRAVFTNSLGTDTTTAATLTVENDS